MFIFNSLFAWKVIKGCWEYNLQLQSWKSNDAWMWKSQPLFLKANTTWVTILDGIQTYIDIQLPFYVCVRWQPRPHRSVAYQLVLRRPNLGWTSLDSKFSVISFGTSNVCCWFILSLEIHQSNLWCKSTWKRYLETLPPNFSSVGMKIWLLVLPLGAFHGLDQPQNGWFELYILCDWNCFATFNEGGECPPLHGKHPCNSNKQGKLKHSKSFSFTFIHASWFCEMSLVG